MRHNGAKPSADITVIVTLTTIPDLLLVLAAAFGAGLIDSMVGGGGLVQLPALFSVYPNTPPPLLLGTSKFAGIFGTASAVTRFASKVVIPWRALLPLALGVLISSALGAVTATHVAPEVFRPLVPIMLIAVLIYLLRRKDLGAQHAPRAFAGSHHRLGTLLIIATGFYDGFFGPGTGSFLMFIFVRFYGYDFLNSAASARVLNVATNGAALAYFAWHGYVLWQLGVGMAICNVLGSFLGTRLALRGGSVFVRKIFIVVVSALILRTAWTALHG
ncbi:MAG: sulfite exporter TauE/SafE family protein [Povalibacter sp.]